MPEAPGQRRSSEDAPSGWMGLRSTLRLALMPFGSRCAFHHRRLNTPERMKRGLVILLPGIDGCGPVTDNIAWGLGAAAVPYAIQIRDWRSSRRWSPRHLSRLGHNRAEGRKIAGEITRYQAAFPERPVHLIAHSAGGGLAMFVLENLTAGNPVETVVLLAAALSRRYDMAGVLEQTRRGIWNLWSPLDFPTLGLGTLIFGTMDRRRAPSVGAIGLARRPAPVGTRVARVHDFPFRIRMAWDWNWGGHFGCTNAWFVRRHIAPIVHEASSDAGCQRADPAGWCASPTAAGTKGMFDRRR